MSDRNDVSVAFTEDATVESICEQLKNDWQAYRDALDLSGDYFDRKSQVESVEVTSVQLMVRNRSYLSRPVQRLSSLPRFTILRTGNSANHR